VNAPRLRLRITDQLFKSNLDFCVVCRLTSGAFTIDSSTPTLRINLNEQQIFLLTIFAGIKLPGQIVAREGIFVFVKVVGRRLNFDAYFCFYYLSLSTYL
jgi:hypothetical protein